MWTKLKTKKEIRIIFYETNVLPILDFQLMHDYFQMRDKEVIKGAKINIKSTVLSEGSIGFPMG